MKKIVSMLLAFLMAFCLVACGKNDGAISATTELKQEILSNETNKYIETTTEELVTEAPRLSSECDKVLCSGCDGDDGPLYELVATQTEDYSGVVTKIGVIKDNQWLVELTAESPFVDEDGTLKGYTTNSLDDTYIAEYIGNGCFYYFGNFEVFYNSRNGRSYCMDYNHNPALVFCKYQIIRGNNSVDNYTECLAGDNNGKVIFDAYGSYEGYLWYKVLDLETMTIEEKKPSVEPNAAYRFYPYSEGLFAVLGYDEGLKFYDIDGKCMLDLTEYKLTHEFQKVFFKNGKCTFNIINSNGTEYKITIDKKGEVISSVEL